MRPRPNTAQVVASIVGFFTGAVTFFAVLFDGRLDMTRTAMAAGYFSNFYDLQARAFLAGRLDVPTGSLGIEGFIVDGRTYTYFAPLPAVLRMPILAVTDQLDGRLTLASMALAWSVFAGATVALVWAVRRFSRGDAPVTRQEAVLAAVFIAAATGGTTLTYDAGLPWVYHEAYIWAAATAVGGLYWLVRTVEEPTRAHALWLGGFALAAVMSRIPAGWAVSGAALVTALWLLTPARRARNGSLWSLFLMAGSIPILAGVAYNMVRFDHPWLFPLDKQVWTEVNAQRRAALAANGGTLTGPQFLPSSLVNYFRPDGIRIVDHFPWVTLPPEPAKAYAGAFVDQVYRTGSVTTFMPLLFALSVVAAASLLRFRRNRHLRPLIAVFMGGIAVSSGIMGYGYLSNRYVSDLVPGLVVGGAIGLWALAEIVMPRRLTLVPAIVLMSLLGGVGLWANAATGYEVAQTTWRGDRLANYLEVQRQTSSAASLAARIIRGEGLPSGGRTDDLFVAGDCDALYLNTGDAYEPWILVERRPEVISVRLTEELRRSRTPIAVISSSKQRTVYLETAPPRQVRVTYTDDGVPLVGAWVTPYVGEEVRLGIAFDTSSGRALISSTPGGTVGSVPFTEWNKDWQASSGDVRWTLPADGRISNDVTAMVVEGRRLALCERLVASAHRDG